MKDIYRRLGSLGVDAPFLRSRILPDWWDDSEARVPATRAIAEFTISRLFGIPIAALRNPDAALSLPVQSRAKLKLRSDATRERVAPGLALADRAARLVVDILTQGPVDRRPPMFSGPRQAQSARAQVLAASKTVTLASLFEFAWASGIVVLHLANVPKGSKTFDGMACFIGQIPVVVLASGRQSPPWIAFHLAHELAHLLLGHAQPGAGPVVDAGLDSASDDRQERDADAFALELLTGSTNPPLPGTSLNGPRLAAWAKKAGMEHRIDPGTLALVVGRFRRRLPAAQVALKALGLDVGAQGAATRFLQAHLPDGLPEDLERLFAPEPARPRP